MNEEKTQIDRASSEVNVDRLVRRKFYILSLKWTCPNSAAFTLWGKNNSGYCWRQEQAGIYDETDIEGDKNYYDNKTDTFAIDEQIANPLFKEAEYDGRKSKFLLNNKKMREILGISKTQLKGGMSNIKLKELKFSA